MISVWYCCRRAAAAGGGIALGVFAGDGLVLLGAHPSGVIGQIRVLGLPQDGQIVGLLPVLPRQLVPGRLRLRAAFLIGALQLRKLALLLCVVQVIDGLPLAAGAVFP